MRFSAVARVADATKTHVGDKSAFWAKVRKALVVNPDIGTGAPLVVEHRWPQPGSRPEKFTVPSSKASDIAQNPYFLRDFRRMYPSTATLTQTELATLLIAQGGFETLPAPAAVVAGELALTANAPVPSLSSLYLTPVTDSTPLPAFKAPRPPGNKYAWAPAAEVIPHEEDAYFPMWAASAKRIA